jgi:hypothetical protein
MPSTPGSRFSESTSASTSACVAVAGRSCSRDAMPARSHARRLPLMYEMLAGLSPTNTTARHGARRPDATIAAISSASSERSVVASCLPSTTTVRSRGVPMPWPPAEAAS